MKATEILKCVAAVVALPALACLNNYSPPCPGSNGCSQTVQVGNRTETVTCNGATAMSYIQVTTVASGYNGSLASVYDCYYTCTAFDTAGGAHTLNCTKKVNGSSTPNGAYTCLPGGNT